MNLETEKLLCLQLLGCAPSEILNADSYFFNDLLNKQRNAAMTLEKASSLLLCQAKSGIRVLPFYHPDFPERFREIGDDCPPLIYLLGNTDLLKRETTVAIIGARKADRKGCEAAYKWGTEFARNGHVVVSGLALGCDAAAHRGCLAAQGETIAIVASGLDITHPKENKPLQDTILNNGGLLLSEQIIGTKANPRRLVARNRLQAALSQKVVVAQCPIQSGTMYTVRFAQKYHKEIFAVQFAQYDAHSSGNKHLIKEGIAKPLL